VNGYQIEARRRAREVVGDMRWQGMTVPPLYARMAGEFEDLVRTGGYAAWVAANRQPALTGRQSRPGGVFVTSRPPRNRNSLLLPHVHPVPAGRPRRPLPGPVRSWDADGPGAKAGRPRSP
jgi:hypothetical protein